MIGIKEYGKLTELLHKNRYITVQELADIAKLHRSTIEKYISLLLTIQDIQPYVKNPPLAETTLSNLFGVLRLRPSEAS